MAHVDVLAEEHLARALADASGRSSELIARDDPLRQSIIALRAGTRLGEHNSPPAATLHILRRRVRVDIGEREQGEFGQGELWVLTHERHAVLALDDSVLILTTVASTGAPSHGGHD